MREWRERRVRSGERMRIAMNRDTGNGDERGKQRNAQ
jgi:hypothetical protein